MGERTKFFSVSLTQGPKPRSRRSTATRESRYWRSFKNSQLSSNLFSAVSSLEFSPVSPNDLAATVSTSLLLFSGFESLSPKPFSPISNFSDVAYSPSYRYDGALVAAGGQSGLIQIFDPINKRPVLRRLRAHTRPVRVVRYPKISDKAHLFSAGDDAVFNYWDTAAESIVSSFPAAHKDYIRAGAACPVSPEVFATGSYDHSVKLWDIRANECGGSVAEFNHGSPVESIMFLPSGGMIATAGGNSVKIWDVYGGCRLIHSMDSHNKTVTSLCNGKILNKNSDLSVESRIFSVSIDGYLKVFDYSTFKVTHSTKYPSMLLSVAASPNGFAWVVGSANGVIYSAKKKEGKDKDEMEIDSNSGKSISLFSIPSEVKTNTVLKPSSHRYFTRGQGEKPSEDDYMVKISPKVKLAEHDVLLKKFRHKESLVSALNGKHPDKIMAVMQELVLRKKLIRCVENLEEEELGQLLGFFPRYATVLNYSRFLIGLAKKVLQIRSEDIKKSDKLKPHVKNLKRVISEEIKIQNSLQEIQGMISPLLRLAGK
ncbi:putative U3 small nucleolar RNA-associated protein [Zostera marina]|uniref:Putative U3 small nucleolar RNA-associated protein n=1 Tax=Zostera marina TaxID=29655 RepID=A0A0K9NRI7_ZOSMR|nr:putative U3 small nucleolar RNA-associated protein [Zostera marina]